MEFHIEHHNFFLLRTPLLSNHSAIDLSFERLKTLYQSPILQEAILVASPEFYERMMRWLDGELVESAEEEKTAITLAKYLLRMSSRCTPFGLFAGISMGKWEEKTALQLPGLAQLQRHSRLDMDLLCAFALKLTQTPAIKKDLIYFPNNTLYRVGNEWRYVEYRIGTNVRDHFLVNVPSTDYLERVLTLSSRGGKYTTLVSALINEDIDQQEASDFVDELIESRVLVSELEPGLTGEEYISQLYRRLAQYENSNLLALHLQAIEANLRQLDRLPIGMGIPLYGQIKHQVEELNIPFTPGQVFQVDLHKPAVDNTLGTVVMTELTKAVTLLAQLPSAFENSQLKMFKEVFYSRYEEQEVPLVEVLDTEMGIGYPVSGANSYEFDALLDSLPLEASETDNPSYEWSPWQQFLFEKYLSAIGQKEISIELSIKELTPFLKQQAIHLPSSLYSFVSLMGRSPEAVDAGEFQLIHQATSGPSAANLLGRFCHLNAQLSEDVQSALRSEEATQPDAVFAEIVHINQARIGNIVARPVLRAYEIPILAQAGVDSDHTIHLADLTLSMQNNQLILRSRVLGKQVVPRLSTAHNYAVRALPQYRFLCDLQFQSLQRNLKWNWGALQHAPFLPRVCYGKTILSKARWILKEEVTLLNGLKGQAWQVAIMQIRHQRNLPRHVAIIEGDHHIRLDLDNSLCLKIFQSFIKPGRQIVLEECLHQEGSLVVDAEGQGFFNEMIVPFSYQADPVNTGNNVKSKAYVPQKDASVTRRFGLGSEWVYVKLYCGKKTADQILIEVIEPLSEKLLVNKIIDQWFFIRYMDGSDAQPRSHLRIRFHQYGSNHLRTRSDNAIRESHRFYKEIIDELNRLLQPYVDARLLSNITTDTYLRELERYGHSNIFETESLFFYDSIAVVKLLHHLQEDEKESLRLPLALKGIDALLDDFKLTLDAKKQLLEHLQMSFKREFTATHALTRKALGNEYRKHRSLIEQAFRTDDSEDILTFAKQIFGDRSKNQGLIASQIMLHCQNAASSVSIEDLLSSYIHMFINRLYPSRQRMHELVVYDFLFQYYVSLQAQQKRAFVPHTL